MSRRAAHTTAWFLLGSAMAVVGYLLVNTTFMLYDDEGYILQSIRAFLAGQPLYDVVFTQYGPWPFLYHEVVTSVLQTPLTHMLGRELTVAHWVGCSLITGAIALRLSGRHATALVAAAATFGLLWQMTSEPTHPGSLLSVLVAIIAWLAVRLPVTRRPAAAGAAIGALCALACLTKINVGALAVAGLGAAGLRLTKWPVRWNRWADSVAAAGFLLIPWLLMGKKLGESWPLAFAANFTLSAATLLWIVPGQPGSRVLPMRMWAGAAAGFAIATGAVVAATLAQGSTWRALVEGILIAPLRHPAHFTVVFKWTFTACGTAVVALFIAAWSGRETRQQGAPSLPVQRLIVLARLGGLIVFVLNARAWLTIQGVGNLITVCLPLTPLFLVPLSPRIRLDPMRSAEHWMAGFAILPQVLHAFPVAGSQMGWGTFLFVGLLASGLDDALKRAPALFPSTRNWIPRIGWSALLAAIVVQAGLLVGAGWIRYRDSRPLDLPGAEDVRIEGRTRSVLRIMTLNSAIHADVLFERPGMFSFNVWSGVPTPTFRNATHWFWLLGDNDQHAIIDRLSQAKRSAIITNDGLERFLGTINVPMDCPLQSYIERHYAELLHFDSFHFLVPRGQLAVPFGQATPLARTAGANSGTPAMLIEANVLIDGRPDRAFIRRLSAPWESLKLFAGATTSAELVPIDRAGRVIGDPVRLPAATDLHGLYRLRLSSEAFTVPARPEDIGLVVADPRGRELAEALF